MLDDIIYSTLSRELIVIIISAIPVAELRGAIPVAINLFHITWYKALLLSVIGNMLPVPVLLLFLDPLAKLVSRVPVGRRFVEWVFRRTRRHTAAIRKYETIGLAVFVAIPLPFTGAWTGCLAAFLMGLKFRYAFFSILIGVILAGFIVVALSLLGWVGLALAAVGLVVLALLGWWKL